MDRRIQVQDIHYTVDQIIEILVKHQATLGVNGVGESEHGSSVPLDDTALIQMLQAENRRLRMLLIEALLDKAAFEEVLGQT
jgi:hypothetical protein